MNQTGIYFLLGRTATGRGIVYVGQAVKRRNGHGLSQRLEEHLNARENYWTEAFAFTATDNSLSDADVSYLENWFYAKAKEHGQYELKNGNTPNPGNISEAQKAALQGYIDDVLLITAAPEYHVFEGEDYVLPQGSTSGTEGITQSAEDGSETGIKLYCNYAKSGAHGKGISEADGKITVLAGSRISDTTVPSCAKSILDDRRNLEEDGTVRDHVFVKDWNHVSMSAAAGVIRGGGVNGWEAWKTQNGTMAKDLAELQAGRRHADSAQ